MISASYRNNNSYSNGRNSPNHHRHSRFASQNPSSSSSSSNHGLSASSISDFVYKGANKHHWAKLQSKIKQRLMAENISYIDDEEEVARRSMPPPPALYISPPYQHSSSRRKIERRGRGNRSCSTNPERRRRTNSKNIGTFSPKISLKEWQHITTSSPSPSLQTSSEQYRTSIHLRPMS